MSGYRKQNLSTNEGLIIIQFFISFLVLTIQPSVPIHALISLIMIARSDTLRRIQLSGYTNFSALHCHYS